MSSSGRYKSRLFNYLSRKSTRLNDNFNRAARHVKVASIWGVQILLYPVYVLVQATRLAGHQLQQAVQQTLPQLKSQTESPQSAPPTADQPIQQVLSAIDTLALVQSSDRAISEKLNESATVVESSPGEMKSITVVTSESGQLKTVTTQNLEHNSESGIDLLNVAEALISDERVIQAIACDLTSRHLVLVTTENQILDILTPQQQEKLQQRISWELSQFWEQWRMNQQSHHEFQPQVKPPVEQRHVLPPVRLFWRVIAWVQTGPIAIAANLFQEANLVTIQEEPDFKFPEFDPSSLLLEKFAFLDNTFADLETYPLLPPVEIKGTIVQRTQGLLQRIQARVKTASIEVDSSSSSDLEDNLKSESQLRSLIKAAVDYFFGKQNLRLTGNNAQTAEAINGEVEKQVIQLHDYPESPQLKPAIDDDDPWLTSSDSYSEIEPYPKTETTNQKPSASTQSNEQKKPNIPLPGQTDIPLRKSTNNQSSKYNQNRQQISPRTTNKKSKPVVSSEPVPPQRFSREEVRDNSGEITPYPSYTKSSSKSNRKAETAPEWIDTHSTPVGYVKHPLELLLEWLDRSMLWLEELIVKIWRRIIRSSRSR